eukprot:CAMPEP_0117680062 /NCGR_PEP_ID=MMETSP0804-20121206/18138_1 /TAXON_ID=1074897 /ORGANISM="Tetraselmis astigmatica, Strain CCMP880" /LENGTH=960 /DNA_ID=CAMNT_0005489507 /DNA_START=163 /DNA_END=3045 /DNA_ORIENTATION=+
MTEIPTWRVDILYFALLLATLVFTKSDQLLVRYLERKGKTGFLHIYDALKEELLLVGIISLLLSAVQEELAKICVSTPRLDEIFPSFVDQAAQYNDYNTPATSDYDSYGEKSGYGRRLFSFHTVVQRWRVLLAANDGGYGFTDPCPGDTSQLFPTSVLHALHIMLFLVAMTQILYSCLVLILCLWKVSRWRQYENAAQESPGLLRHLHELHHDGTGCQADIRRYKVQLVNHLTQEASRDWFRHAYATVVLMFSKLEAEQYIVMRHIFVTQLGLDSKFDFLRFVKESMESEFAALVGVNSYMWFILFVWIALPPETYVSIWIPLLNLCLTLVIGGKLTSVLLVFHARAKAVWQESGEAAMERSLSRAPMTISSMPVGEGIEEGDRAVELGPVLTQKGAASGNETVSLPAKLDDDSPSAATVSYDNDRSNDTFSSSVFTGNGPVRPSPVVVDLARALSDILQGASNLNASEAAKDIAVSVDQNNDPQNKLARSTSSRNKFFKALKGQHWVERTYHNASADTAALFWGGKPELILQLLQIAYFGMSMQLSLSMFTLWLDLPPGYLLPVFGPPSVLYDLDARVAASTIVFELFTNLFVLLWVSLYLLPVYALVSTVGSHCPSSVLSYAERHSLHPKLAKALHAVAKLNTMQEGNGSAAVAAAASEISESAAPSVVGPEDEAQLWDDIIDLQLDKGPVSARGHKHGGAVEKLMGAMYEAQFRRLQNKHLGGQHASGTSTWHAAPKESASPKSYGAVKDMFAEQPQSAKLQSIVSGKIASPFEIPEPEPTPSSSSPSSPAPSIVSGPTSGTVAHKQQLLMNIVQRQEKMKQDSSAQNTPRGDTKGKGGAAGRASGPPAGFSLARHSMAARINIEHVHQVASASAASSQRPPQVPSPAISKPQHPPWKAKPLGSSLARSSATPTLHTVHDTPFAEAIPEATMENGNGSAPDGNSSRRFSLERHSAGI